MKKSNYIYIYAIIVLFILFLSGIIFKEYFFSILTSPDVTNSKFFIIYIIISIIYFLSPLPVTIVILLNGYLFQDIGLYISLALLVLGSSLLCLFSNNKEKETIWENEWRAEPFRPRGRRAECVSVWMC